MLEVLAVIAIVAYVIGRQLLGEALRGKRVIALPAVLTVIGLTRLGGGHHVRAVDVACLAVSAVIALAIGLGQGAMMRLEERDGALWGRMPARSLLLWAALIASRVTMTVLASALGAHVAASSAPILLLLGVNRLGQAAAITRRALASGIPFATEKDGSVFLSGRLEAAFGSRSASPGGRRATEGSGTYDTQGTQGTQRDRGTQGNGGTQGAQDGRRTPGAPNPYDPYDAAPNPYGPYDAAPPLRPVQGLRDLRSARRRDRRSPRSYR